MIYFNTDAVAKKISHAKSMWPRLSKLAQKSEEKVWLPKRALKKKTHANGMPVVLGRMGSLEVRMVTTNKELRRVQRLRYIVFYEELGAVPSATARITRKDSDPFDLICDHMIVVDYASTRKKFGVEQPEIVATYRLLRHDVALKHGGFYSQTEFDLSPMLSAHPHFKFLELGRSCVVERYRGKRSVELLWKGIWAYITYHKMDAMIGCASFKGIDVNEHAPALDFLKSHAFPPQEWRVDPLPNKKVALKTKKKTPEVDEKSILKSLPPLIKGYLRLGAYMSPNPVVDYQFKTTDIFIVLPVANIQTKYLDHYS